MPGYWATNEPKRSFVVTNVRQVLLYVNSNEKWTRMKNTGLKMPEKDQIYFWVGFSYYQGAKIIGKSFSIWLFSVYFLLVS